jgi:hypothetical protein
MEEKRKRGGQKGNQNARKHGFYASRLTPVEIREFWDLVNTKHLAPEIAAMCIKVRSTLARCPSNVRVLREAAVLISGWCSSKYDLDKKNSLALKKLVRAVLEEYARIASPLVKASPFVKGLP